MHLILYSKPDCCLCASLHHKLQKVQEIAPDLHLTLTVRDILTNPQWEQRYNLTVPVLCWYDTETELPRFSPRADEYTIAKLLRKHNSIPN
jgi:hypothetical protein